MAPWEAIVGVFDIGVPVGTPVPVGGGWSHSIWQVATDSGRYAVKEMAELPGRWWIEQLESAVAFELKAWQAGVVTMPEPVPVRGTGDLLGRVDAPGTERHVYRCHRWVDGQPCGDGRADVQRSTRAGEMIAALARLDVREGTTADRLPWNALDAYDETVTEATSKGVDWAGPLADLRPLVSEIRAELHDLAARAVPLTVCHGDVDPKNTLVDGAGRLVLTDWDSAGPRLLASELLDTALSFAGAPGSIDEAAAFAAVDAYRDAGGPRVSFAHAASPIAEGGFRWIMVNAWRALGHRGVSAEQEDFAASLVRQLAPTWPASVAATRDWAARLAERDPWTR